MGWDVKLGEWEYYLTLQLVVVIGYIWWGLGGVEVVRSESWLMDRESWLVERRDSVEHLANG